MKRSTYWYRKAKNEKNQILSREYCDKGYAAELKEKTKAANERREKALEDCDHA
jgi:hypothetical protein